MGKQGSVWLCFGIGRPLQQRPSLLAACELSGRLSQVAACAPLYLLSGVHTAGVSNFDTANSCGAFQSGGSLCVFPHMYKLLGLKYMLLGSGAWKQPDN
jgi:hypothetical protein